MAFVMTDCVLILLLLTAHVPSIATVGGDTEIVDPTAVKELVCSISAILQQCSDLLEACGEVCDRLSQACDSSFGSKYFSEICRKKTISDFVMFLQSKPVNVTGDKLEWKQLRSDPRKITNYVMSNIYNEKVMRGLVLRSLRNIRNTISTLGTNIPTKRTDIQNAQGRIDHKTKTIDHKSFVALSCFLFTVSRDCSWHYTTCNVVCEKISLICEGLCFYSKLLSYACQKRTLSDILHLYRPRDQVFTTNASDVSVFWFDFLNDPVLLMKNVAEGMFNEGFFKTQLENINATVSIDDAVGEHPEGSRERITDGHYQCDGAQNKPLEDKARRQTSSATSSTFEVTALVIILAYQSSSRIG